jgi:hypothetical protein
MTAELKDLDQRVRETAMKFPGEVARCGSDHISELDENSGKPCGG